MTASLVPMGRPRKKEPTEPVRIPQSLLKRIKRVAAHQDTDPGDYIAKVIARLLDKDERKMLQEIEVEQARGGQG